MIHIIKDLPDHILGFVVSGTVTGKDYETVLIPAVEAELKESPKVRMLYQIDADFVSYDLGAMWDDTKIGLKHLKAWERIALVTDSEWIGKAMHIFGFAIPGQVRIFTNDELSAAKEWLSE